MDLIFAALAAIYPGKWNGYFRTEKEIRVWQLRWAKAFDMRGITTREVKAALDRLPDQYGDWPPSLGEFLGVCRAVKPQEHRKLEEKRTLEQIEAGRERIRQIVEQLARDKKL